ncbi:MAG: hypothetical protein OWU33_15225 [Firmicutes bacterium]|nr:hypothetical protein [Bacillota bacterium]
MLNPFTQWHTERGLTPAQAAVAAGVARSSIYALENGTATRFHYKVFALIASTDGEERAESIQMQWTLWHAELRSKMRQTIMRP